MSVVMSEHVYGPLFSVSSRVCFSWTFRSTMADCDNSNDLRWASTSQSSLGNMEALQYGSFYLICVTARFSNIAPDVTTLISTYDVSKISLLYRPEPMVVDSWLTDASRDSSVFLTLVNLVISPLWMIRYRQLRYWNDGKDPSFSLKDENERPKKLGWCWENSTQVVETWKLPLWQTGHDLSGMTWERACHVSTTFSNR